LCEKTSLPKSLQDLSLKLHFSDGRGNFQRYDPVIEQALLQCIIGRQRTLLVPDGNSGLYNYFDFEKMEQRSASLELNGKLVFSDTAPVQIVAEIPWNATAMVSLVAEADKCLRRKVILVFGND
jgi:hypothetical protein